MSYYPPRSRSRSPRSRASYMDTNPDPYRPDWEYDRYGGYDRERGYEYGGRRGRSRSPVDDVGRKRRRSMSPYERDRYEPRPRYNDDYDTHSRGGYGGYSPRRNYGSGHPRRPPPDPHTFEYPATLKQFAEWFRFFHPQEAADEDNADKAAEQEAGDGTKPRNGIKSRWEKYKKDFAANQLQIMFDHHRKFPWFAEKYDPSPEMHSLRMRVRKEGWKGRIDNFLHDLESGKFDPDLNESEDTGNKDGANGEPEANGANDESKTGDEDVTFNDADDDAGDNDAGRGDANGKSASDKRNNRGEEISVPTEGNQIMIRTIPPDIGRVKLEEACGKISGFIHLALGDPLQKRNYYRAGWMKFSDDADIPAVLTELGEKKIEGFKLHVTHNLKPFVNKIRYTPDVASKPERLQKDLATAKQLAIILEEQAATLRQYKPVKGKADQEPNPDGESGEQLNGEAEQEDDPEPMENGSEAVERRIEKVMTDMREHGLLDLNDEKAYEEKKTVVSLDLYLAYLRAAYNTCYYCSVVTDHVEELQRKCIKHVRKPLSKAQLEEIRVAEAEKKEKEEGDEMEDVQVDKEKEKETKEAPKTENKRGVRNDDRWLEWLDSKLALLMNRDGVDPRAYMGKNYDDELAKAVEPHVKQEDEGKFRCKTCQKLFKATSFVEKHISNKHAELVKQLDDLPYFNNFILDPHHIQPFTHPPPNTGNTSQGPPPQAYGIQPPPAYHGADYGRPGYYPPPGGYPPPGNYPPPYHSGHYDPYYQGGPYGAPMGYPAPPASRRDEALTARRLSDRISGFAPGSESSSLPPGIGLPPKPSPAALDQALTSGSGGGGNSGGGRRRNGGSQSGGPPPPPPPDAKEDPRAAVGKRVSYHDMDSVAEGDVELMY